MSGPTIGFVGLSHLGIVSSLAAASKGSRVIAYDPRNAWIMDLKAGRLPLAEPGLEQALKSHRPDMQFTSDIKELQACALVYFSMDTPTDEENQSSFSGLMELIQNTVPHLGKETVLIVLSQVAPGFTRTLSAVPSVKKFSLFYQVETLIFGQAWERATKPERIIVGSSEPKQKLPKPYLDFLNVFGCPILKIRYESAELAKISINLCLAASISATNTLAEICEAIGADWSEIVPTLRMDKRIGPHSYLNPGLGIGGGNLERDLVAVKKMASKYGTEAGIIDAFLGNSHYRRDWVLRVLHENLFCRSSAPVIAVWGLTYKPNTDSVKNSPALALIQMLERQISLQVYDPQAVIPTESSARFKRARTALEACHQADALIIMTAWEEFSKIGSKEIEAKMRGRLIIDPWAVLSTSSVGFSRFDYYRLGTPAVIGQGSK